MPHPKANKRTTAQIAADAVQIEEWVIQGKSVRTIVKLLAEIRPYHIGSTQVHADIDRLKKKWLAEASESIAGVKARDLKTLDKLQEVSWDQFQRSTQDAVVETSKVKGSPSGAKGKMAGSSVEKASRKEGQCGDPQYLRVILDVQKRRSELLGLNAPAKTELTGEGGGPVKVEGSPIVLYLPEIKPIEE